jgi:hypothetical protein
VVVPGLAIVTRTSDVTGDLLTQRVRLSLDRSDPIVRQLVEERARQALSVVGSQREQTQRGGRSSPSGITQDVDASATRRRLAIESALERLTDGLRRELDLPATLLVGDRPELFAEADRIRAESELRVAVVPPLVAQAPLLAAAATPLWLVTLVPIGMLLVQGVRREDDTRRLIGSALLFGDVRSAAVEQFDRELSALDQRGTNSGDDESSRLPDGAT